MSILGLLLRSSKGSRLTSAEVDNNMTLLAGAAIGLSRTVGVYGIRNATYNTRYDFSVQAVVLQDADKNLKVSTDTRTITCDPTVAGPIANGRDQSAVFADNVWFSFWYIYRASDGRLDTIASLSAVAPTLPSGYTHYAYICTVYRTTGGVLTEGTLNGNRFETMNLITNSITWNAWTNIDCSPLLPSNSTKLIFRGNGAVNVSQSGGISFKLRKNLQPNNALVAASIFVVANAWGVLYIPELTLSLDSSKIIQYLMSNDNGVGIPSYGMSLFSYGWIVPNGDC